MAEATRYAQQLELLSTRLQKMVTTRNTLLAQDVFVDKALHALRLEYNNTLNMASDIAVLPDEILALIFEGANELGNGLPLIVTQVTRRWRDIAISTPKLWSKIKLIQHEGFEPIPLAELYFNRSKAVPFDLEYISDSSAGNITTHILRFGHLLATHMHRCRRLSLNFIMSLEADVLLDILAPLSCPLLEFMNISCRSASIHQRYGTLFAAGAPVLAELRMSVYPCSGGLPPLESITVLRLDSIASSSRFSSETLRDALASMKHITMLEVCGQIVNGWTPVEAIELPVLLSLTIHAGKAIEPHHFHGLYEAIEAPSLEYLSLVGAEDDDMLFLNDVRSSEREKFPALLTLDLNKVYLDNLLHRVMRALPSVETVILLGETQTSSKLLDLLWRSEPEGAYWPRLRRLALPSMKAFNQIREYRRMYYCMDRRILMRYPIPELALCTQAVDQILTKAFDAGLPFSTPRISDFLTMVDWKEVAGSWRERRMLPLDA